MYCRLAEELGVHLELINTTGLVRIKEKYGASEMPGGLAGADPEYQQMAINAVTYAHEAVEHKVGIIGVGGINNGQQALKMKQAGANLLSVNTAVRERGVRVLRLIERELIEETLRRYMNQTK